MQGEKLKTKNRKRNILLTWNQNFRGVKERKNEINYEAQCEEASKSRPLP